MLNDSSVEFLGRLSEAFGPSGFEKDPARMLKAYVEPFCDEVKTDRLGSLLFTKKGEEQSPVVLLPGHIDEVGFVVAGVAKEGFLTFGPVGGWFDQVLLAQRVIVRTRQGMVEGVVSAKPPHVLSPSERGKVVKQEKMYIDIGASNKDEVEAMGVRVGDPIVPDSRFSTITKPVFKDGKHRGEATIAVGKAFDDRVGAFIAAEVLRRLTQEKLKHPNTVVGAGTVQEEVGLRGATTTAWVVEPDVCLTLEVDISRDVPGVDGDKAIVKMGQGPSVLTFDASMVPNQELKELVIDTAEKHSIPYQLSYLRAGGTDAGVIHKTRAGCPSLVLAVPTRHIHSHVSMMNLSDVENLIELVLQTVLRLDKATVGRFTDL